MKYHIVAVKFSFKMASSIWKNLGGVFYIFAFPHVYYKNTSGGPILHSFEEPVGEKVHSNEVIESF